jgi:phosphate transport system permease protein
MKKKKEKGIALFFMINGASVILILCGIFYLLLSSSFSAWKEVGFLHFLTGRMWNPSGYYESVYGILSLLRGTLMVTFGAIVIALPIGVACAGYLAEVAAPWEREIIKPIIEMLAGVPSVVIGFFGLIVLNRFIAGMFNIPNGLNAINGSILLALMALPTIISIAEDALAAVPNEFKEASLALGASRWQTLRLVVFPAAASGVSAGIMLGVGRAIGETMTVVMATGNALAWTNSYFDSVRTMTANIAIELGEVAYNTTHYYSLFAVGFVLFTMTFVLSLFADIFLHRAGEVSKR